MFTTDMVLSNTKCRESAGLGPRPLYSARPMRSRSRGPKRSSRTIRHPNALTEKSGKKPYRDQSSFTCQVMTCAQVLLSSRQCFQ